MPCEKVTVGRSAWKDAVRWEEEIFFSKGCEENSGEPRENLGFGKENA